MTVALRLQPYRIYWTIREFLATKCLPTTKSPAMKLMAVLHPKGLKFPKSISPDTSKNLWKLKKSLRELLELSKLPDIGSMAWFMQLRWVFKSYIFSPIWILAPKPKSLRFHFKALRLNSRLNFSYALFEIWKIIHRWFLKTDKLIKWSYTKCLMQTSGYDL